MTTNTPARPSIVNAAINLIIVGFVFLMVYLLWPYAVAQWNGAQPQPVQQLQPATIAPTPARPAAPAPVIIQPAPVIVQSVPAGEAPQQVQLQPIPAPAAPVDSAPAVDPAPRPLIIVHQVSADGQHQVITGSGACKVTRVAARCSK